MKQLACNDCKYNYNQRAVKNKIEIYCVVLKKWIKENNKKCILSDLKNQ